MASNTVASPWTKALHNIPHITQVDIDTWADKTARIPKKKQTKGYSNWIEGYIHDVEVKSLKDAEIECGVTVRCRAYPSMKKTIAPYSLEVRISKQSTGSPVISNLKCQCKAGNGHCSHMIGLLYTLCHYKKMGYKSVPPVVSKTSLPQTWNVPSRDCGITPQRVDAMTVTKIKPTSARTRPSSTSKVRKRVAESVVPSIYCPVLQPLPSQNFASQLQKNLESIGSDAQMLKLLQDVETVPLTNTKYGEVPKGSVLSYQQQKPTDMSNAIIITKDVTTFPSFDHPDQPSAYSTVLQQEDHDFYTGLQISSETAHETERATRNQSTSKIWKQLRSVRLTSSKFHQVYIRQTNFEKLAQNLQKGSFVQTRAMRAGLRMEPEAANQYTEITGNNVFLCGFIINPSAPHLGTSPDRVVYDPSNSTSPFGILEIKCPSVASYTECKYLKVTEDGYMLKRNHEYYHQVMGQMGLTGMSWCDFLVHAKNDYHMERIRFNVQLWSEMKEKLDMFYFEYLLPILSHGGIN